MANSLRYDLHSHSNASDGALSPIDLVKRAKSHAVDVLALTDHDTTAGLLSAKITAKQNDIKLIYGVEISCTWAQQTIHIVGLCIKPENSELQNLLKRMQDFRQRRGEEIGRKLEKNGVKNALIKTKALAVGNLITRSHYGRFLIESGYVNTMQGAFKKYLNRGQCGFVNGLWANLSEVVGAIHASGGLAVVAHPRRYNMNNAKLSRLFEQFVDLGGDGLEVVNAHSNLDDVRYLSRCCNIYQLNASVGSDFHSPNAWIELGKLQALPKSCVPIWTKF